MKEGYDKRGARTVANKRRRHGVVLRIYECPSCGRWHVTHKVE